MSNIFKDIRENRQLDRNVFDLSLTTTFSSKVGMCIPVNVQHTVPNSYYKITPAGIIRTAPMQKANFTTIKANLETFFVPYSQLWSEFNRFIYGRGDRNVNVSNVLKTDAVPTNVPYINYKTVASVLLNNTYAFEVLKRISFVIEQIASSPSTVQSPQGLQYWIDNVNALTRDWFGYDIYLTNESLFKYCFYDIHGRICVYDMIRNFDMLGYGNLLPFVKPYVSLLSNVNVNLVDSGQSIEEYFSISSPFPGLSEFNDLLSTFDTNSFSIDDASSALMAYLAAVCRQDAFNYENWLPSTLPSAFPILATLKIWSDYYRTSQYDQLDYAYVFNCDYMQDNGLQIAPVKVIAALRPHYHLYKKDRFTGGYPNSQFGDVAVAGLTPEYSDFIVKGESSDTDSSVSVTDDEFLYTAQANETLLIKNNAFVSALAIRQANALQRYKERILRAGDRLRNLQQALYGVQSRYMQDLYVDLVDACDGVINVNPVASTAETGNGTTLGDLGAYAVGTITGDEFEFNAKDHGMLVTMLYILPETKYNAFGFDAFNMKLEQFDFYSPDFQNLGLAPVSTLEYNLFNQYNPSVANVKPDIIGYLSRYYEYKTALSKVHGEFYSSLPQEISFRDKQNVPDIYSVLGSYAEYVMANIRGSKSDYVSPRSVVDFSLGSILRALYVSPNDLDSLFYASADERQLSDHFDFELHFEIKAILPMSVTGLPY